MCMEIVPPKTTNAEVQLSTPSSLMQKLNPLLAILMIYQLALSENRWIEAEIV